VAYFLLTGRAPFTNRTATQIMAAHMYEQPAPVAAFRPEIDSHLDALVGRCLAKKPADRFQSADALHAALAESPEAGQWTQREAAEWWRRLENATTVA
jgi:serine/threonine protein kinase